jgi:hypothetical protein
MMKEHRLAFTPVLVIDCCPIFHPNGAHHPLLPRFQIMVPIILSFRAFRFSLLASTLVRRNPTITSKVTPKNNWTLVSIMPSYQVFKVQDRIGDLARSLATSIGKKEIGVPSPCQQQLDWTVE